MSPIVYRMNTVLSRVVQRVPVGTNLGLFHLLWMLLSGRLLLSRGAVIPGLAALGLAAEVVRRAWAALAYGKWHAAQLLEAWGHLVQEEQVFHAHQYGGYRPVACDLVGFFRPRLQAFYRDRWPVEGLPLTAKQMVGAARQFVFAPESRQRLPELALVAGAILMYVAATQPALPTGFWDRAPKPTSGRLRRLLAAGHCGDLEELPEQLGVAGVISGKFSVREMATKSPWIARHDYI